MYESLRRWTLAILKVPPEPRAPVGDPASLRVFNAGRNYFRLRLAGWAVAQFFALAGFIFWTALLIDVEGKARAHKESNTVNAVSPSPSASAATDNPAPAAKAGGKRRRDNWKTRAGERIQKAMIEQVPPGNDGDGAKKRKKVRFHGWAGFRQMFVELALLLPAGAFLLIWGIKIFSFLVYLVQIPLTYAVRRLDYEMRWYMVTDRSLRLRHGVWRISESTMSFANIQQVVVSQGPLQRLLGLADVRVKSAGGGGGGHYKHSSTDMHEGLFHHVTNAMEIRDLIQERLRRFREAGLGDPDEKPASDVSSSSPAPCGPDVITAARDLAAEARALRASLRA